MKKNPSETQNSQVHDLQVYDRISFPLKISPSGYSRKQDWSVCIMIKNKQDINNTLKANENMAEAWGEWCVWLQKYKEPSRGASSPSTEPPTTSPTPAPLLDSQKKKIKVTQT